MGLRKKVSGPHHGWISTTLTKKGIIMGGIDTPDES